MKLLDEPETEETTTVRPRIKEQMMRTRESKNQDFAAVKLNLALLGILNPDGSWKF